jgi:hypothetical protein
VTVALTAAPPCGVSVKVELVIVAAFIAVLKVAVMADVIAPPLSKHSLASPLSQWVPVQQRLW